MPPRVSIGLPVHNGAEHLASAIDSLLAQTYTDFELLVSDNASSDGTPEILAALAGDQRVQVTRHADLQPSSANFNDVLNRAQGTYFMWAADDDLWDPHYLENLVALLDDHPDAVLAFSAFANVSPGDPTTTVRGFDPWPEFGSAARGQRMRAYLDSNEADGKANLVYGLMRRDVLTAQGGMVSWPLLRWGSDMVTIFRLLAEGGVAWHPAVMFRKRLALRETAEQPAPDGAPVPLRHLPAWSGYLLAHLGVVASSRSLNNGERLRLTIAILAKLGRGYRGAFRRLIRRVGRLR